MLGSVVREMSFADCTLVRRKCTGFNAVFDMFVRYAIDYNIKKETCIFAASCASLVPGGSSSNGPMQNMRETVSHPSRCWKTVRAQSQSRLAEKIYIKVQGPKIDSDAAT